MMEYRGFLIDENLEIAKKDIENFFDYTVYNASEFFSKGTPDDHIIEWLKSSKYILVTEDVRMTIEALIKEIPVLFVKKDSNVIKMLDFDDNAEQKYSEIYSYLRGRLK